MAIIMKASEFVKKLEDIAKNYKTLYVMGCFGAPLTKANKNRYTTNHEYNKQAARTKHINAASEDTFGFDCVNLIKGVLWGWNGDKKKTYGGAKYNTKGVPDTNADGMIKLCKEVSTDFNKIAVGEAVWCSGHIGVYIGDGLAIECTPAWKNKVQITAVNVKKDGYNTRTWKKHGKLPWIDHDVVEKPKKPATTKKPAASTKEVTASEGADLKNAALTGTYVTTGNLNMRDDAGITKKVLCTIPKGTKVKCYGYYSRSLGVKWYYVQVTLKGVKYTGFCSSQYLKKT
jgi:hypothetical protein